MEPTSEVNCSTSPEFENNHIIQPNSDKVCLLYLKTLAALQTRTKRQCAASEKWLTSCEFSEKKNLSVISQQDMCSSAKHISLKKTCS